MFNCLHLLTTSLLIMHAYSLRNLPRLSSSYIVRRAVSTTSSGEVASTEFRVNFAVDGSPISPWHDIPLKGKVYVVTYRWIDCGLACLLYFDVCRSDGEYFNFVNEIPKNTKAKMEVSTKEQFNPIAQGNHGCSVIVKQSLTAVNLLVVDRPADIKKGKLRDYHGPIFWNYGCLPQTWEDPNVLNPDVNCKGDNDPVDVVEIGSKTLPTGTVTKVKVLGILAMIDDGELDWKVIAIDAADPLASSLNDIVDVEKNLPGVVSGE